MMLQYIKAPSEAIAIAERLKRTTLALRYIDGPSVCRMTSSS